MQSYAKGLSSSAAVAALLMRCAGDITAPDAGAKIAAAVQKEFGRLDVLVNNAGFTWDGVIHKMSDKQWQVGSC
jgi:3-oxoacyl-[acyl-carrier protein] reductase